nr:leucine-rich repeat domain-containing protein [Lachnospiraceae bacterium]
DTLAQIDDWAFAGCRRLREVTMPRGKLGKGVFQDCEALRKIRFSDGGTEDAAALLSEVARHDIVYLTDLAAVGSAEWLRQWDAWLLRFLEMSDQEGYSGQVPCGEEDYGTSDVGSYESGRRREKAERCLLRLMYPEGIAEGLKERLQKYISDHTKGSAEGEEAWQMLLQKHPEEKEWYRAFAEAGGLHEQNRDQLLGSIPEEYAEMKAFFINYGQEKEKKAVFFANLAL